MALAGRRGTGLLGLIILAGVLTTMLVVAVVLVIVAIPIGRLLAYLIPLTDALLITLGVLLLLGRNPFERLPGTRVPIIANPFGQAYLYGLILGPLALPCAGAFALSPIAYSVGLAETLTERARLTFGFEAEGLTLEPGPRPPGYREGTTGWFVDEPWYGFPGGGGMPTRLTAVGREEAGRRKIVHMHVSVGVPDEEVTLTARAECGIIQHNG